MRRGESLGAGVSGRVVTDTHGYSLWPFKHQGGATSARTPLAKVWSRRKADTKLQKTELLPSVQLPITYMTFESQPGPTPTGKGGQSYLASSLVLPLGSSKGR